MSDALRATGRPIVFAMSNGADPAAHPWLWGGSLASLWRTGPDLQDNFTSLLSNFESNVQLYRYAGAGHWNDPDLLEVGNGGSSELEYLSEFSLWAEMASPLIASTNLSTLSRSSLAILENANVIAVDQDPLGAPGVPISSRNGLWVLSKRLRGGDRSVLLFNATDTATTVTTSAGRAGLPRAEVYRLRALWSGHTSETGGEISAFVPAHGVSILRVTAISSRLAPRWPPSTVLALGAGVRQMCAGQSTTVTESLTDNGVTPLAEPRLSLRAPPGWKVKVVRRGGPAELAGGRAMRLRFRVTAPANMPRRDAAVLTGTAVYAAVDGRHRTRATLSEPLCPPPS
jgi:alpha-galactosidase